MALSPEDRAAIVELISLHGHVFDDGDLDRLDVLFTPSVVYDVSALGGGALHGIEAIRAAALALGDRSVTTSPTSSSPSTRAAPSACGPRASG